jgi:16S rRNA (cytosine967-C5)-methyltransferase
VSRQPGRRRPSRQTGPARGRRPAPAGRPARPPRGGPSGSGAPDTARRAAFDTLVAVTARGAYGNLVLPRMLTDRQITGRDAALATELGYGTLRARGTLDAVLGASVDRPMTKVDPRVREALRLGAYQLLRTRIPPHAAISETVELARAAIGEGPSRFVNAVLRRVSERDWDGWVATLAPDPAADPVGWLALRYAHPEWVVRAFADALGERLAAGEDPAAAETAAALAADDAPTATHLVARPGRIDRDALAAESGGEPGPWSRYAVRMAGGDPGAVPSVADGRAAVQDEGSQLCALAAVDTAIDGPDARWLDLCAGPGGKAGLLAALAAGTGAHVTAVEVAEHRAGLVRTAVDGLPATVLHTDGRRVGEHPDLPEGGFDRVLVDVPCTGLGALRRRPEARWRRQPTDLPALTALQRELLGAALRAVRPGGLVTYVTCSPHPAETVVVVAEVARRTGARRLDATAAFGGAGGGTGGGITDIGSRDTVQLWPHRHATDAMFCAQFSRGA